MHVFSGDIAKDVKIGRQCEELKWIFEKINLECVGQWLTLTFLT